MHTTLSNLKQAAIAARRGDYFVSSAGIDHQLGRIVCRVDFKTRNPNSCAKHVRVMFDLNGKRIAEAALSKLLNA